MNHWIFWDIFTNVRNGETSIDALYANPRYPDEPDEMGTLFALDAPPVDDHHFGQIMWGWLISPMEGEYTFFR